MVPNHFLLMFVRVKKIKGQPYAYLVQNTWTKEGARQKVAKYLGKTLKPEKKLNLTFKEHFNIENLSDFISKSDFKEAISHLALLELHNHGIPKELFNEETLTFAEGNRQIVLELNQGFLCQATLERVLQYKSEDDSGFILAELLLASGLNVEKELFVELFEKLKPKTALPSQEGFYY